MSEDKVDFKDIIKELIEVFKKLKRQELVDVLKQYKSGRESDVTDLLLTWNTEFNRDQDDEEFDEDGKPIKKKKEKEILPWIKIFNHRFPIYYLYTFSKEDQYDFNKGTIAYFITLNKGIETKSTILKDVMIRYTTEQERDENLALFEAKLMPFGIKFV